MMRLKYLAVPALAALVLPVTADAGILRGRFGGSSVVVSESGTPAAPAGAPAAPAPQAPPPTAGKALALPAAPPPGAPKAVVVAPGAPAPVPGVGGCGPGGCGKVYASNGGIGGFLQRLCGGGDGAAGHGGMGGRGGYGGYGDGALGNHPPAYDGHGFRGFGFCQPPFQAAPWYLYWPYDAHFQLPAPINAPFYPPQQLSSQWSPYFAAPAPGFGAPPPGMAPPGMMPR
jgi:hypothetical protein